MSFETPGEFLARLLSRALDERELKRHLDEIQAQAARFGISLKQPLREVLAQIEKAQKAEGDK